MAGHADATDGWRHRLREARRRLDLTQDGIAERAGVSKETVRAYEEGRRSPGDRQHLVRILEAVELPRIEINDILEELGFAPVRDLSARFDGTARSGLAEAQQLVDVCPWPAFAVNNLVEVVVANEPFRTLFAIDLARDVVHGPSPSLLALATTRRFADHLENWDEAVRLFAARWKGELTTNASVDDPTPQLSKVLDSVTDGDASYLLRILKIWSEVEAAPPARRWFYPIVWRDDDVGLLTFRAMVHNGDDPVTLLSFNDWIPADAHTWSTLQRASSHRMTQAPVTVRQNRPSGSIADSTMP
jgi:transcriptional regulator with XRE-family HTH domain